MSAPFTIPETYRRMFSAGLLDHGDKEHCLLLSDTEWLSEEEIEQHEPPEDQVPGLVPFAQTGRGDTWCWYTAWNTDGELAVAFCPHDEMDAMGYAPSLEGCVYRLLLEEMAGSWLADRDYTPEEVSALFLRYAEETAVFLPESWAATLREISRRPVEENQDEMLAVLTREEAEVIIRRDLAFEHLDRPFRQFS